jgi:hypothetical protein
MDYGNTNYVGGVYAATTGEMPVPHPDTRHKTPLPLCEQTPTTTTTGQKYKNFLFRIMYKQQ